MDVLDESPDELAVRYEHLAAKVARKFIHRLSPAAAGFDDLKQVCWLAVWEAARSWDGRIPWKVYATILAERAAEEFIMIQRRRGMTNVGERVGEVAARQAGSYRQWRQARRRGEGYRPPGMVGLGDLAGRIPDARAPAVAEAQELLAELVGRDWLKPRTVEVAELIVLHGMTMSQVARHLGISRQRVNQILFPLRAYLREKVMELCSLKRQGVML